MNNAQSELPAMRGLSVDGSSQQLKEIIENINGGVSVAVYGDEDTVRLAYANDHYYSLLGYTKEQFFAELDNPHDTLHPEDAEAVFAAITEVKKTGRPATFRYRVLKRDGSVAYVRCSSSVSAITGLGERVLISVLTDITSSVEVERLALVSGQRLHAIMDNIDNGVAASIIRENGSVEYIFVTDRYYEMLGYTREEYHKEISDPFQLIYPEDAEEVRKLASAMRSVGESRELRYRAFRRDGRVIWLDVQITMMSFADVEEPVQLSVFTDVTRTVEAAEQLAAQRDRINEMLNTTPSGIAVIEVDPADMSTLHTTYYNDRFFAFSGYTREEYDAHLKGDEMGFVFKEDAPVLLADAARICSSEIGDTMNCTVRCHTKSGGYRWLLLTGLLAEKRGNTCVINVSLVDVTAQKEAEDRQRISEELLRIAAETDKRALITYNVKDHTCHVESRNLYSAKYGETLINIPDSLIERGIASPESAEELRELFERIQNGEQSVRVSLLLRTGNEEYQWFECTASAVYDADGNPDRAVLVFHNITEQRVKEAVYKKWQHSIESRPPETYTLFRCNLNKDSYLDEQDGKLLRIEFPPEILSFDERTREYAEQFVYPPDREAYSALLNSDTLLAMFYRGEHAATLEYRELGTDGSPRWRLLTVEMVEYLNSTDIQAFLLYEDINEKKTAELKELELAQTDPLTGLLNRVAFAERVESLISREAGSQHALLMMDMDGFKQLNDTFGHAAGDQALLDTAAIMRSMVRDGDLICRLGGDEFLVWLRGIPYDAVINKIARQICEQVRKAFSSEIEISASVGVAVYPRDGHDFDELYHNADKALYRVKKSGKNNYAFFSAIDPDSQEEGEESEAENTVITRSKPGVKRRMLIVDDDASSRATLTHIFKDEYQIETAQSGTEAMLRLRHFGTAVSVVLLDLVMPGMDGYEVLLRLQSNVDLRTIPVVVVSVDDERETLIRAIESGAADYVAKPVDAELIRLRVRSAVSKAENERLRAQNSYLQLQRDEELKFRTVLESTGTVVVEYDWHNRVFIYDNTISNYIAGVYDHRSLWQIFLSDMVADSTEVKLLQDGLLTLAGDRKRNKYTRLAMLKTPAGNKHWFRMNVYKRVDSFGLAEKMVITLNDVHEEVLGSERLLFQATRDDLTGLYNRAGFIQRAEELIAAKPAGYYVMSCIDIEKFKVINDQYGSHKGDEVLREMAGVLQKVNGGEDIACCRVTADNFAVLYPARLMDTAELTATHTASETLDGSLPPLKICIGRCLVDDKDLPVSAIYDRASIAKETVKGRYDVYIAAYDDSMRMSILRQQEITGQMRNALKSGQFEVWLQPQFNHATGMLSGAEALVRWRHPKEGVIPPAEFIPIFERNGFVYEVDKFVWEQTCRLLRKWLDQGLNPVPVSVNISRYDVFRDDMVSVIKGLVQKYSLPCDLLRLEITESAFTESTDQIISTVREFVDAGFVVEIDDFGSGYSSLNTLKDVPAQVLKMDMKFLENDTNAQRGGSIIESVVRMARWLGMSVIAEGVETLEQADYLRSIGCEHIQGYLYSRPTQSPEYEKLFTEGRIESKLSRLKTAKSWNNNAFWNPKSMETLIFNSYIGGACIFEYRDGKTELLRYNDGFGEVFRPFMEKGYMNTRRDILTILDDANAETVRGCIRAAIETNMEAACECAFVSEDGGTVYVHMTLRLIAQAGDRSLLYSVVTDITAQREAERSEREAASRIAAIMDNAADGITAVILRKDGTAEFLLTNDRYYELMGYTREQYAAEVSLGLELMHPKDREKYEKAIHSLDTVGQSGSFEFRARRRDRRWVWLRDDIAVITLSGVADPVQLSCFTDITAQRQSEERLRFVNEIAGDILALPDAEEAVQRALMRLLTYFGAERSYIVELDVERGLSRNTYEVCAEGIPGEKERLQDLPFKESDFWYASLTQKSFFVVEDTEALEDAELAELLRSQSIRSLVLAPLWRCGRLIGFVGVDNPESVPEDIRSFTAPADCLTLLLSRRDQNKA